MLNDLLPGRCLGKHGVHEWSTVVQTSSLNALFFVAGQGNISSVETKKPKYKWKITNTHTKFLDLVSLGSSIGSYIKEM
jgi:hypothetical protein